MFPTVATDGTEDDHAALGVTIEYPVVEHDGILARFAQYRASSCCVCVGFRVTAAGQTLRRGVGQTIVPYPHEPPHPSLPR